MRSLGGQAYLILSGAIKQPAIRLANCNMMNYERGDDIYYLFYNFLFFSFTGGDGVTLRRRETPAARVTFGKEAAQSGRKGGGYSNSCSILEYILHS